jgi:hypothetical protein
LIVFPQNLSIHAFTRLLIHKIVANRQKRKGTDVDDPDNTCLEHKEDSSDESEVGVADSDVLSWTDFLKV